MTSNYRPATMRASDADRDAVVSDLSEHFQAGRLTAGEFDERTGQALTARTWGELGKLVTDLPAARPAAPAPAPASSTSRPQAPSGRAVPVLAAIAIAAIVLVHVVHGGWGLIWLLLPALLIARRVTCH
jgi:ferric-dicitrate binding protein FerR (iron transport regulator)